jgi:hypothetical protein
VSTYQVTVTYDGEVLDTFDLDGYDLSRHADQVAVGREVESAMGSTHVALCAEEAGQ